MSPVINWLAGIGLVATLVLAPLAAVVASETAGNFHWARGSSTFTLQIGNNLDSRWSRLLKQTVDDWNKNDTITFRIVSGSSRPQECRPRTGKVEICNWRYGTQEGWLGLTRLYFDERGRHIEAATAQLNDSFFDQANGPYNSDAARLHTICHELGHTPGLGHPDTMSCMNHSQFAVFNYVTPGKRDFRDLAAIYRHKDGYSTVVGKQKVKKKNKDPDRKTSKRDSSSHASPKHERRHDTLDRQTERAAERIAASEVDETSFFSPTMLPSVPSGLLDDQTVLVERAPDGRKVVSIITWAVDVPAD